MGEGLIVDPEILVREPMQDYLTPHAAKGNWRRVRRVKCIGVLNLSYNDFPHIIGLSASCWSLGLDFVFIGLCRQINCGALSTQEERVCIFDMGKCVSVTKGDSGVREWRRLA